MRKTIDLKSGLGIIMQLFIKNNILDDSQVAAAVKTAVALGYRHIDTAQAYGNEVICCEV